MDILRAIWKLQAASCKKKPYFCISTKRGDSWKDHFFKWPNIGDMEAILKRHPSKDYNLYFCPLPFDQPHRRKEYVLGSHLLWADIDEADPKKMRHPPHILWESSPGRWAGLWSTERWLETDELENFNKRMTYGTGSDVAGWDLTQVLRVPGTRNHKYKDSPEGRLVRVDLKGRLLLKDVPEEISRSGEGKALELYKKWEKKLSAMARAILRAPSIGQEDRSKVLWKLYHLLFDAGLTVDEIRILAKASVWNRFSEKGKEDEKLKEDIERCLRKRLDEGAEKRGKAVLAKTEEVFEGYSMDTVTEKKVDWLWFPYIARGSLTIIEGDPGVGKSYFCQMVCAALCDGGQLPGPGGLDGWETMKIGNVLYFSVEDDPATVIKPRLNWNKCKNQKNFRVYPQKLEMDEEGLALAERIVEKFSSDLVVFDTLNYFVGGIDTHKANEVSQKMEHFQRLASKHNAAVVVLRHLTKNSKGDVSALYRGSGSISFTGSAREVLTVGLHPEEPDTVIVSVTKLNLARFPKALGYRIEGGEGKNDTSRFIWSDCLYDLTSDDIVNIKRGKKENGREKEAAIEWLKKELSNGPKEVKFINSLAEARSISKGVLLRAKKDLEIIVEKIGDKWFWKINN